MKHRPHTLRQFTAAGCMPFELLCGTPQGRPGGGGGSGIPIYPKKKYPKYLKIPIIFPNIPKIERHLVCVVYCSHSFYISELWGGGGGWGWTPLHPLPSLKPKNDLSETKSRGVTL